MYSPRNGGSNAWKFVPLLLVKSTPLWSLVDKGCGKDEATFFTNELTRVVVAKEICATAFGTDGLATQCRCQRTTPKD